jgi:autotransporter-associated beta strand protein
MRIVITLVVCLLADVASAAAACVWTGAGPNANWSTATNWTTCSGRAPQSGDELQFPEPPGPVSFTSVNDIPNIAPSKITVSSTNYQISGAAVRLSGPTGFIYNEILASTPTPPSFTAPITLNSPLTITNSSADHGATFVLGDLNVNGFPLLFAYSATQTFKINGAISGNGSITINANGRLVLTKASSYTGTTFVGNQASLVINDAHALGATGFGNETVLTGGNLLIDVPSTITIDEGLTFGAPGGSMSVFPVNTGVTFTGALSFTGTEVLVGDSTTGHPFVFTGPVTGDTLFINNDVTFTNPANNWNATTINNGHVTIGAEGSWPARASTINFGTFDLNGFDLSTGIIEGCGTLLLGSATLTLTINVPSNPSPLGPVIGTGTLVKMGDGPLTLEASGQCVGVPAASFAGTLVVNQGHVILGGNVPNPVHALTGSIVVNNSATLEDRQPGTIGDQTHVTINTGGTWLLDDHTETIATLAGTGGAVSLGVGTLIVSGSGSTTFGGVIGSGTVGLNSTSFERMGTGSLTLTGQNTYTGRTLVGGGSLIVNGAIGGVTTVDAGTLGGVGTIGSINPILLGATSTGVLSPGSSPGILHTGMLRLVPGLSVAIDLNGLTAGTGYDQLDVNGDVILTNPTLTVTRRFGPPQGAQFTIMNIAAGHSVTGTFNGLPEGATLDLNGQHFSITYKGGDGNDVVLTALEHPPAVTYYLSEGATGAFFDEDVLIANPNAADAPITLTFSKEDGSQVTSTQTVAAHAHATVHVDTIPGMQATAASTQVTSEQGLPLVVERTMFWDQTYYAGHTGSAVDQPEQDWFFAEGSQGFFQTFVLVINPNATPTDVTFTFLREADTPVTKTITVGASTRLTLDCGSVPDIVNRSFGITVHATQPIMAERSMYFGTTATRLWSGGTESAGVTALSTHWFMAEGATGGFFDTFILLSNPNSTPANVTLQYLLDTGDTVTVPKTIGANARLTTNIESEADARLHNAAVSTVVTSDQPIIAERSMYWPGAAVPWGEGHNSFGVVDAGLHWGLAEGRVGGPLNFHTYILLANPQSTAANVTVNFLRESGAPVVKTFTVPPTSRFNIDTSSVTELHNESFGTEIQVTNNVPIIVERSMYWDSNGFQFSGGTNATGSRLP